MSKQLLLITGASGHLGFRTLVLALEGGYRARVTLRELEQVAIIEQAPILAPYLDSIEYVMVPDITAPDAYTRAIENVDGVLHIASPIPHALPRDNTSWRRLFYDPVEQSVLGILNAARTEPSVQRVVITYSIAVVATEPSPGATKVGPYDIRPVPTVQELQAYPNALSAYAASNILKYAKAMQFCEGNAVAFKLVNTFSGYLQGRNELYTSAKDMENMARLGSNEGIMYTALGKSLGMPRLTHQVYLDDVARAHVVSLERAQHLDNLIVAGNGGQGMPWSEVVSIIERLYPTQVADGIFDPRADDPDRIVSYDIGSSQDVLGFEFAGVETMVRSVLDQYLALRDQVRS